MELQELTLMEKVLALGLVAFLLVGGLWVMGFLGRLPPRPDWMQLEGARRVEELQAELRPLESELWAAQEMLRERERELAVARADYEFRREEYRTFLDRGRDDPVRLKAYETARDRMEDLQRVVTAGQRVVSDR